LNCGSISLPDTEKSSSALSNSLEAFEADARVDQFTLLMIQIGARRTSRNNPGHEWLAQVVAGGSKEFGLRGVGLFGFALGCCCDTGFDAQLIQQLGVFEMQFNCERAASELLRLVIARTPGRLPGYASAL